MFNLIVDIHIMVQNRVSVDQTHMTVSRAQVPIHRSHMFFFWFSADHQLAFSLIAASCLRFSASP